MDTSNLCGEVLTNSKSPELEAKMKAEKELRNKSWEQLTSEEKIERMREVIKDLTRSLIYAQKNISNIERLFRHDHKDGKVVTELIKNQCDNLSSLSGVCSTVNYF